MTTAALMAAWAICQQHSVIEPFAAQGGHVTVETRRAYAKGYESCVKTQQLVIAAYKAADAKPASK